MLNQLGKPVTASRMTLPLHRRIPSALRRFIASEETGGLTLIACAAAALLAANSPLAPAYAALVGLPLGGTRLETWVDDAPMALFFLLVGLEIKREALHGQLRTWGARALPGLGALGGMVVPALVYAAINRGHPAGLRGWAVPSATDIAFALGVLSLLGDRVPASLRVFLTALAVLDDLGAVLIIAVFYTGTLSWPFLALAGGVLAVLVGLNRRKVVRLWPYLVLGVPLWFFTWRSGVHATVAGVLLALTIPAEARPSRHEDARSPLHRLEAALEPWVGYLILPVFAFVSAGVPLGTRGFAALANPVTLGVALGLALGKQAGVFASVWLAIRLRLAARPAGSGWLQVYGVAVLCGIGFTMSLFVGLLAFAGRPALQDDTKLGVLAGSILSACAGLTVLRLTPRVRVAAPLPPR